MLDRANWFILHPPSQTSHARGTSSHQEEGREETPHQSGVPSGPRAAMSVVGGHGAGPRVPSWAGKCLRGVACVQLVWPTHVPDAAVERNAIATREGCDQAPRPSSVPGHHDPFGGRECARHVATAGYLAVGDSYRLFPGNIPAAGGKAARGIKSCAEQSSV